MLRERILLAELAVGTVDLAELGLTVGSQPESRADGRGVPGIGLHERDRYSSRRPHLVLEEAYPAGVLAVVHAAHGAVSGDDVEVAVPVEVGHGGPVRAGVIVSDVERYR